MSWARISWARKRLATATVIVIAVLIGLPNAALAHAAFVSSTPEAGATLSTAPGQVTLTFSEPLNTRLSRASLQTPDGSSVAGANTGNEMVIDLTTNEVGVYEVSWTTVSLVDGHTLAGSFRFGVGVSPGIGAEGGTAHALTRWDLLVSVSRLIEDTSLLLLVGLLLLGRLARRQPTLAWVRTPTLPVFGAAFIGGLAVVLGEVIRAAPAFGVGAVLAYITAGAAGWYRLARVILEAFGVLAAWRWPRAQAPLVTAAIVTLAAAGHAAAVAWGVSVEAAHLVSAGLWAGGILALALQRPPGGVLGDEGRKLLDRFTPVALAAFAITAGTGVIRAVQEVGSWAGLFDSSYGLVLIVKVVLVLVMVQLSVLAWRRIAVLTRSEAVTAILVVGAAALLSAFPLPPARQAEAAEQAQSTSTAPAIPSGGAVTLGSHAGSVLVGLTLQPGKPGPNELSVYVQSLDGPQVTAALPVVATVNGTSIALSQCADSCRSGEAVLHGGEQVKIDVGTPTGGTAIFHIPHLPAPSGDSLLRKMEATMGAVTAYRQQETLTAGLGTSVDSTYAFAAPNSFESRTREGGSSTRTVWIGDTRYLQQDGGAWKVEQGAPAVPVPTYIWDSFTPYHDVRIGGATVLDGVKTTELLFAGGDQQLPIWFSLWVDADGYVHRAEMRAPGHFMDHTYYAYNTQIDIAPPKGAKP